MTKKLAKILTMGVLIIMSIGIFAGCGENDYGYKFHFDVDGGNGEITIENEISVRRVKLCSDEAQWCELECADSSHIAMLLGGKKGSRELTFIATPNEGYQVKEWLFNGEIVEGNKTTSYKAKVSSQQNYNGVISVRFEVIQG
jgi:hypothetical protein